MDAGKSPDDVEKSLNGMASFYYNFRVPWNSAGVEVGFSTSTAAGSVTNPTRFPTRA